MGKVINIESQLDTNVRGSKFVLDTNILYWMFYDRCSYSHAPSQKKYSSIVTKLKMYNQLFVSPLSLYELFVIIEKNEYRLYCMENGYSEEEYRLKEYRKIQQERKRLQDTLELTYKQINQFTKILPQNLTKDKVLNTAQNFSTHKLDVFDQTLISFCKENSIHNIITDDGDYATTLDVVNVYTANQRYFR